MILYDIQALRLWSLRELRSQSFHLCHTKADSSAHCYWLTQLKNNTNTSSTIWMIYHIDGLVQDRGLPQSWTMPLIYCQTSTIRRVLVGNKIVGAAPTTFSFST